MKYKFITFPKFPTIPSHLYESIYQEVESTKFDNLCQISSCRMDKSTNRMSGDIKISDELMRWLNENVMPLDWYVQYAIDSLPIHKDPRTGTRIMYVIDTGGEVSTNFYDEEGKLVESAILPLCTWSLLKSDIWHDTTGFTAGRTRIFISARVHGRLD